MYAVGQKVVCNGNHDATIVAIETNYNGDGFTMYTVRLWDGLRHIGDVMASEASLYSENMPKCAECGCSSDNPEGICYECQCFLHSVGAFDMDGRGWR